MRKPKRRLVLSRHAALPAGLVVLAALVSGHFGSSEGLSSNDSPERTWLPGGPEMNPWVLLATLNPTECPWGFKMDSFASGTGLNGVPLPMYHEIDLAGFENTRVRVRFYFDTMDSLYNQHAGWALSDIAVDGTALTEWTVDGSHVGHGLEWHGAGSAWDYYNPDWGTYTLDHPESYEFAGEFDHERNWGTIISSPFNTGADPVLSFWTIWEIEGVYPDTFDLMRVEIEEVPADLEFEYLDEDDEWTPTTSVVMFAAHGDKIKIRARVTAQGRKLVGPNMKIKFTIEDVNIITLNGEAERFESLDAEEGTSAPCEIEVVAAWEAQVNVEAVLWDDGAGEPVGAPASLPVGLEKATIALEADPEVICADEDEPVTFTATVTRPEYATLRGGEPVDDSNLKVLFKSEDTYILTLSGGEAKEESIDSATGKAETTGEAVGEPGTVWVTAEPYEARYAADVADYELNVIKVELLVNNTPSDDEAGNQDDIVVKQIASGAWRSIGAKNGATMPDGTTWQSQNERGQSGSSGPSDNHIPLQVRVSGPVGFTARILLEGRGTGKINVKLPDGTAYEGNEPVITVGPAGQTILHLSIFGEEPCEKVDDLRLVALTDRTGSTIFAEEDLTVISAEVEFLETFDSKCPKKFTTTFYSDDPVAYYFMEGITDTLGVQGVDLVSGTDPRLIGKAQMRVTVEPNNAGIPGVVWDMKREREYTTYEEFWTGQISRDMAFPYSTIDYYSDDDTFDQDEVLVQGEVYDFHLYSLDPPHVIVPPESHVEVTFIMNCREWVEVRIADKWFVASPYDYWCTLLDVRNTGTKADPIWVRDSHSSETSVPRTDSVIRGGNFGDDPSNWTKD